MGVVGLLVCPRLPTCVVFWVLACLDTGGWQNPTGSRLKLNMVCSFSGCSGVPSGPVPHLLVHYHLQWSFPHTTTVPSQSPRQVLIYIILMWQSCSWISITWVKYTNRVVMVGWTLQSLQQCCQSPVMKGWLYLQLKTAEDNWRQVLVSIGWANPPFLSQIPQTSLIDP